MAIVPILNWLAGDRDYDSGVSLYHTYGSNTFLKSLFDKGPSYYTNQKLLEELITLSTTEASADQRPIRPLSVPKIVKIDISTLPDELLKKNAEKGVLYREAGKLHSNLERMTPEQRQAAAAKILDNFVEIEEIWGELNYFQVNKELKPVPEEKPVKVIEDRAELVKRRQNLRTYITKAEKKLNFMPDGQEKEDLMARKLKYENERDQIEKQLID